MSDTHKLYSLLTRLGAVPEDFYPSDPREGEEYWWDGFDPISDHHALAILCDKARRVCDNYNIIISRYGDSWSMAYASPEQFGSVFSVGGSSHESYESALIAGLEWIVEQRGAE